MSLLGLGKRFLAVNEAWTSITCWRCNSRGVRPKQSYFKCSNCGWQGNADLNGGINIAKRLVKNFKLTKSTNIGKKGLGKYLPVISKNSSWGNGKVRHSPKARKRSPGLRPKGQQPPGAKLTLKSYFQHDQSVSTETLSSAKLGNGEAGHIDRSSEQHTIIAKGSPEVKAVTSG